MNPKNSKTHKQPSASFPMVEVLRRGTSTALVGAMLGLSVATPSKSLAATTSIPARQNGVNITPSSPTDFSSADFYQSLKNLKADHANSVNLVIRLAQSNVGSTDIGPTNNTPTDASLIQAIQEAHALGLTVTLKPHVDPNDGQWRAYIDPQDRATWFKNYDSYILHYAQLAQANGVEQMIIGTELIYMTSATHNSTNTAYWNSLIASVRSVYSGRLGYAANWGPAGTNLDEKNQIQFWNKLDFAGIDAYYPLTNASNNSVGALETAWSVWQNDVANFAQTVGKPVIFTEVGYQSRPNAHDNPGIFDTNQPADDTEQANAYQAFFSYWNNSSFVQGTYLWEWKPEASAGGPSDSDYTPQNKPAEAIMSAWYGGTGTPSATTHSFRASASASGSVVIGQPLTITSNVTNGGNGSEANLIIDTEVYDSVGNKVFQKFASGETFAQGQTKTYQNQWTPISAGTYRIAVGIFSNDWSATYAWINQAGTVTNASAPATPIAPAPAPTPPPVTSPIATSTPVAPVPVSTSTPSAPPIPTSGTIDVWWPTTSTAISGTQPFKALLENTPISAYTMYWQVDGGQINQMSDSPQDAPHKESLVTVSGWNWRGNGPYLLTFTAKNSSGAIIASKNVSVTIGS